MRRFGRESVLRVIVLTYSFSCAAYAVGGQYSFKPLGAIGTTVSSTGLAVSPDGSLVVGFSNGQAFRWTAETGMVGLGDFADGQFQSGGYDMSADGSVVVGYGSTSTAQEAFRWTKTDGMIGLGDLPGGLAGSLAYGVSADGTVVVGKSASGNSSANSYEAFRWTAESGMVGLGDLPGGRFASEARGVSADGSIVVGKAEPTSTNNQPEAFRWTSADGMIGLGQLPGGRSGSWANAVSPDGAVIVGKSWSSRGSGEAFYWTANGGMVGLGFLPGGASSEAHAVSADHSVIVGEANFNSTTTAFYWAEPLGMVNLREDLNAHGVESLTGWNHDLIAFDVSADGRTIIGYGRNADNKQEAWYATIPGVPTAWKTSPDHNWSTAANWTLGVPNAMNAAVEFGGTPSPVPPIVVDVPVTLGYLSFNNNNAYALVGIIAITLADTSGAVQINVSNGNHTIAAPLVLTNRTLVSVGPMQSTLSITGPIEATGISLTKVGEGTLALKQLRAAGLSINSGDLVLLPGGGTSSLGQFAIAGSPAEPTARFDLSDNSLVVDDSATVSAAMIRKLILAGRGGPGLGKSWNGMGITSSSAAASNLTASESTSIGYAENAQLPLGSYSTFGGVSVASEALLLRYTRTGDANLNGFVDDDDVNIVGANYAPGIPKGAWALGDFDYNGFVDDDDVTLLGVFYNPSAAPVGAAVSVASGDVTTIPEPTAIVLFTIGSMVIFVVSLSTRVSRQPKVLSQL